MEFFYKNINTLKKTMIWLIVVSHDFEFVRKYSDHVILLDRTILKEGSFEDVRNLRNLKGYLGGPDGFII